MQTGVLIYEDNSQLRENMAGLITYSEQFLLLGSFADATDVEAQVKTFRPDIILMDIDMPRLNGIEAVKKIRVFNSTVNILMLTVFDDTGNVLDAICAGASGYLLKKHLSDRLLDAMKEMNEGGAPMSPGVARMVIGSMQQSVESPQDKYHLSPREKEILVSLSKGNSFKMIAAGFSIGVETVRTHIKRIYEKMQVHSQTEAIFKARNERIV